MAHDTTLTIDFHAKISDETASRFRTFVSDHLVNLRPQRLYLAISSTGGSNAAAFSMIDFLRSLPIPVTTHATGVVDSCAVSIFLSGGDRFANPGVRFLIHSPAITFEAKSELRLEKLNELVQILDGDRKRHEAIFVDRTGATADQVANWHREGCVLDAEQSLAHRFVQEIRQFVRVEGTRAFGN